MSDERAIKERLAMRSRKTIADGPWLDCEQVRLRLQKAVNASGGQKAWALRHEVSAAYVNDVLRRHRLPGDKISRALGLEKALLWRTPNR